MSLVLSAIHALPPIQITNKTTDSGGIRLRDIVGPLLTFVGAVGGVSLGAYLSRRTLRGIEDDRAGREKALDEARAAREEDLDNGRALRDRSLEEERAARERLVAHRAALGACRVIEAQLSRAAGILQQSVAHDRWWIAQTPLALPIRDDDLHAVGAWISVDAWDALQEARRAVDVMSGFYPGSGTELPPALRAVAATALRKVTAAADLFDGQTAELTRRVQLLPVHALPRPQPKDVSPEPEDYPNTPVG